MVIVKLHNFPQPSDNLVVLINKGAVMHTAPINRFSVRVVVLLFGIVTSLATSAAAQGFGFHGGGTISPRGVPASVTSLGFGGHPGIHGVPASVTSLGFGARNNFRGVPGSVTSTGFGASNGFRGFPGNHSSGFGFRNGFHQRPFERRRHHIHQPFVFYSPYYGSYAPYPYPYYINGDDYSQDDSSAYSAAETRDYRDDDDRRVLEDDYRGGLNPPREQVSRQASEPVVAQPSTVLIFKDGHQQEISNYAIVGATLYDLSDGRSKKVQLADLDLTATMKENDQRGVEFQLPATAKLN
jgi:hypothetical protein